MRMHLRNGKYVFALSLLLILSQWLSLAHATEHTLESGDAYCQVCTLQHHFQSTTIDATTCIVAVSEKSYSHNFVSNHLSTPPATSRTIRAPPL
jgi:hypothetical protein